MIDSYFFNSLSTKFINLVKKLEFKKETIIPKEAFELDQTPSLVEFFNVSFARFYAPWALLLLALRHFVA